jgi:cytochrome c peroxidase
MRLVRIILLLAVMVFPAVNAWATEPIPSLPPIPADNTQSPDKIELGKMLFFDPRLSSSGIVSCATCHNPSMAFTDRVPRALGHNHQVGPRNTPTVLNAAFLEVQFWDGRAKTLEEQALGPVQNTMEMANSLDEVVKTLNGIPEYREVFIAVSARRTRLRLRT